MADNSANLKTPSADEARERGRKGGIASGEARRKKKEMKDAVQNMLELGLTKGKIQEIKSYQDAAGKNISLQDAIILAQLKKALKGDTRAAEFIRDTAGMKPTEKQEVTAAVADVTNTGKLEEILKALTE